MKRRFLIVMELEQATEEIREYLEEGWHIKEDYGFMVQLGLYVNDYGTFIEYLKFDLEYLWDNDGENLNYDSYEEFEEMLIKHLEKNKKLQYVNGYSYYIEEEA